MAKFVILGWAKDEYVQPEQVLEDVLIIEADDEAAGIKRMEQLIRDNEEDPNGYFIVVRH